MDLIDILYLDGGLMTLIAGIAGWYIRRKVQQNEKRRKEIDKKVIENEKQIELMKKDIEHLQDKGGGL